MVSFNDYFVGGNVLIEQCMLVFHHDSDCHPFIHYFLKCEIKHNLPYMKEIGIENVKCFHDFFLLFKIQVMKSLEISVEYTCD